MMQSARRAYGYTLIEILIVLFIISIVTTVALLSIGNSESRQMKSIANELTQLLTFAEEQAMLTPSVLGLTFSKHTVQFYSLQSTANGTKNTWLPLKDSVLKQYNVPSNIQVSVDLGENQKRLFTEKTTPQVVISTNGDITPFTIYVGKKGERPHYAITGSADGSVTNKLLS